jgi:hypothetical protein
VTSLRSSSSLTSCQAAPCSPARAEAKVSGLPSSFKLRMFASVDVSGSRGSEENSQGNESPRSALSRGS